MDFEVVASGLNFPEGPVAMQDGSIILVEIASGDITRVWGQDKREVIAHTGGCLLYTSPSPRDRG